MHIITQKSTLHCYLIDTWTRLKTWTLQTSLNQSNQNFLVKCLAMTNENIFVATDELLLHVFSFGGQQTAVMCLTDQPISILAHEEGLLKQKLCIVYQDLSIQIFSFNDWQFDMIFESKLPMHSTLKWVGFSNDGFLVCTGNDGATFALNQTSKCWFPIFKSITEGN